MSNYLLDIIRWSFMIYGLMVFIQEFIIDFLALIIICIEKITYKLKKSKSNKH